MTITKEPFCRLLNSLYDRIHLRREQVQKLSELEIYMDRDHCEFLYDITVRFLQSVMCREEPYIAFFLGAREYGVEEIKDEMKKELGDDYLPLMCCTTPESLYDLLKERFPQ